MNTRTLIAKLIEKGFVFPTCLQWNGADIDARMRAIGKADDLKFMDSKDKMLLLMDFFEKYEDEICEFINQQLEEYLDHSADFNITDRPF